jgi:hypothetical protein
MADNPDRKFSIGIGILHAIILAVAAPALFIGTIFVFSLYSMSEVLAGRVAGNLLLAGGAVGFVSSYMFQKGRKWGAGILAGGVSLNALARAVSQSGSVTEAERQNLQVTRDRVRHPDFAFELPHPGEGFVLVEELPPEMLKLYSDQPREYAWILSRPAFGGQDVSDLVMIQVRKLANPADKEYFRRYSANAMESIASLDVVADTLIWEPELREFRFVALQEAAGVSAHWRCLASDDRHKVPLIVCAGTVGLGSDALTFVPERLALVADTTDT